MHWLGSDDDAAAVPPLLYGVRCQATLSGTLSGFGDADDPMTRRGLLVACLLLVAVGVFVALRPRPSPLGSGETRPVAADELFQLNFGLR